MKIVLFFLLLFSIIIHSQRRNYFPDSDKTPNCHLIKKGTFTNNEDGNNLLRIKFRNNRMTQVYGNKSIVIKSHLKMISPCKFEAEIKSIQPKPELKDNLIYVGNKIVYEIIKTGKNLIIYQYWCNEGRNICTEILEKE
ncbi:hypothetical protein [Chryseobacterium terrae]|uniref:Tissue inhibitor of metalloproteinase n=1 Tax=Chryseobacterium terrae TaxID=3163299 RepID=A0ABW8Y338_9FLAO